MNPAQQEKWSTRFLERVESFGTMGVPTGDADEPHLSGLRVHGLEVESGSARAQVSDPGPAAAGRDPYEVWVELQVFDSVQWTRAEQALAADPEVREQLLDGEFPDRMDAVFARAGLSLLPARARDLSAECSCPAWSPNCPHLLAVFAALAAAFDADPFLLLRWRGRDRARLLRHLRELRAPTADAAAAAAAAGGAGAGVGAPGERPLEECLDDFWREGDRHRALRAAADPDDDGPGEPALTGLGPSGIMVRGRPLESVLQSAYRALRDE